MSAQVETVGPYQVIPAKPKRPLLCRLELHKWCAHPRIKSMGYFVTGYPVTVYICSECNMEHEHCEITGRWHPVEDRKICLRCGESRPGTPIWLNRDYRR